MIPSSYFFKIALSRKWEEPARGEPTTPEQDGPRNKAVRGFKGVAAFLRRVLALTDLPSAGAPPTAGLGMHRGSPGRRGIR
jgi:hypothetical protein